MKKIYILLFMLTLLSAQLMAQGPAKIQILGVTGAHTAANGIYDKQPGTYGDFGHEFWKHETEDYWIYSDNAVAYGDENYWNLDQDQDDENGNEISFSSTHTTLGSGLTDNTNFALFDDPTEMILWDATNGTISIAEYTVAVPEINVTGNSLTILDGDVTPSFTDHTRHGAVEQSSGNSVRTFTIENLGDATLNISGVSISGADALLFSYVLGSNTVTASSSTTLEITYTPTSEGDHDATIEISSDDSDEAIYNFDIHGWGFAAGCIEITGLTSPDDGANGKYAHQGVLNGFEYWMHETNTYYIYNIGDAGASPEWYIDADTDDASVLFYANDNSDNHDPLTVSGWTAETGSGTPVLSSDCGPTAICQNFTLVLDDTGNAILDPTDVDDGSNGGTPPLVLSLDQTAFDCSHLGSGNTVTLTVTDDDSNVSTCEATITVVDLIDPVLTPPADQVVYNDPGVCEATVNLDFATATDNCTADEDILIEWRAWYKNPDGSKGALFQTSPPQYRTTNPQVFPVGEYRLAWRATDQAGNWSAYETNLSVLDNEPPVLTLPGDQTVNNDLGVCEALVTLDFAEATDNCDPDPLIEWRYWEKDENGDIVTPGSAWMTDATFIFPVGEYTIGWRATDIYGNESDRPRTNLSVVDNEPPVLTLPDDQLVNNDLGVCEALVTLDYAEATDNCDPDPLIEWRYWENDENGDIITPGSAWMTDATFIFPVGEYTIGWRATDIYGNESDRPRTNLSVVDNEPPVLTLPDDQLVNNDLGVCEALVTLDYAEATDNCDPDPLIEWRYWEKDENGDIVTPGSAWMTDATFTFPVGEYTIGWRATDIYGNESDRPRTNLSVVDNEAPVITCPEEELFTYNTDPGVCYHKIDFDTIPGISATDNCDGDVEVWAFQHREVGGSWISPYVDGGEVDLAPGSYQIKWRAVDSEGNQANKVCNFVIVVEDNEKPVITCPEEELFTYNTDPGVCYHKIDFDTIPGISATDNCDGDVEVWAFQHREVGGSWISPYVDGGEVDLAPGSYQIKWRAVDSEGNQANKVCNFVIVVEDNEPPVAVCNSFTVYLDEYGEAWISVEDVDGGSTDNCGIESMEIDMNYFTCENLGENTVTLTVTDIHGNVNTCESTVTVEDNILPMVYCNNYHLTYYTDPGVCYHMTDLMAVIPDAEDNCTVVDVYPAQYRRIGTDTWRKIDADPFLLGCGSYDIKWFAVDQSGNVGECYNYTITIVDNQAPDFSECADMDEIMECFNMEGNEDYAMDWDAANLEAVTSCVTDNCLIESVVSDFNWNNYKAECCDAGSITVKYTATDIHGNVSVKTATLKFIDTTDPTFTIEPMDMTVDCDGEGNVEELEAWLADVEAMDECCDDVTITNNFTGLDITCCANGSATVTWTAMDACGNTATTSATFTIQDLSGPEFTMVPEDMTVECDGKGNREEFMQWLNGVAAEDNCCSPDQIEITNDYTGMDYSCCMAGEVTVTWTATNECGASSTVSATFKIEDTTEPSFLGTPYNLTLNCDGQGNEKQIASWLASVYATDICCDEVSVTNDFTGITAECGATGSAMVTWTATDACGNSDMVSATISIIDTVPPVIHAFPDPHVFECGAEGLEQTIEEWLADVDATDNCGPVTVTHDYTGLDAGCCNGGSATVTWTFTDVCGNTSTATSSFTVEDKTAPVFTTMPQDKTVECDGMGNMEQFNKWLDMAAATDACCDDVIITNDFDGMQYECCKSGAVTVTWTARDECGNSSTTSATFTIVDTTDPTFTIVPQDMTLECDGELDTDMVMEWLNGVAAKDVCCGELSVSNNLDMDQLSCIDLMVDVTWTTSDGCGNMATTTATLTIKDVGEKPVDDGRDVVAPKVIVQAMDMTVECGDDNAGEFAAWLADNAGAQATDECCGTALNWSNSHTGPAPSGVGSTTVTFTVKDTDGNANTTTASFIIEDTTAPVIAPVANITIEAEPGTCEIVLAYPDIMLTDNCGAELMQIAGLGENGLFPLGETTETWKATDVGGNTTEMSFTVTVVPAGNAAPAISQVPDVEVQVNTDKVNVNLSGITYGNDCEEQDIMVSVETDGLGAVSGVSLDYTPNDSDGELEIMISPNTTGETIITVKVEDSMGGMVTESFIVKVIEDVDENSANLNHPPYVITQIDNQELQTGNNLILELSSEKGIFFGDVDQDDQLELSVIVLGEAVLPGWISFSNNKLAFNPGATEVGCHTMAIRATDKAGAWTTNLFEVCINQMTTGIDDMGNDMEVNLYPNPTKGRVVIDIESGVVRDANISVMSITGQEVFRKSYRTSEQITFDLSENITGMYMVIIDIEDQRIVKKIILDRQ